MPTGTMIRAAACSIVALACNAVTASHQPAVAQAVLSETQLQVMIDLDCSLGSQCTGNFAAPGTSKKRRHQITRMTCLVVAAGDSAMEPGQMLLIDDGTAVLEQYLPFEGTRKTVHAVNQAVDMLVVGQQNVRVRLFIEEAAAQAARCTAIGTSIRLE